MWKLIRTHFKYIINGIAQCGWGLLPFPNNHSRNDVFWKKSGISRSEFCLAGSDDNWYTCPILHTGRIQFKVSTDYITKEFLNLRVFRTKIGNLKQQIRKDIIQVNYFRKFVTSLVQKLKILGKKWFVVSTLTDDVTNFLKVSRIMSLLICHFTFSIFVLETLKFKTKSLEM